MKYGADKLRERRCSGRGFTLVEMMIGISVLGLILLGSVSLYVAMTRLTASVSGTTSVTLDAANASQRVVEDLRDAQNFMLLDATGKEVTTGLTGSGLRIFYPSPLGDVKVNTNTGTATLTKTTTPSTALCDKTTNLSTLDLYRSDASGNRSDTGNCLWISGVENGVAVPAHALVKTLDPALPTAAQFSKPLYPGTTTPIPFHVEIKITCSTSDPIHGSTSSDSSGGGAIQVTGECVEPRNHGAVQL